MDKSKKNILWVEDELDDHFVSMAKNEGLTLHHVKSKESGKNLLLDKKDFFDAIILDGNILENDNSQQPDTLYGFKALEEFQEITDLRIFVFSGNDSVQKNRALNKLIGFSTKAEKNVYNKGDDEEEILKHINDYLDNKHRYKVKKLYPNVFKIFTNQSINIPYMGLLIDAVKFLNDEIDKYPAEYIRDIFENFLEKLGELDVYDKKLRSTDKRVKFLSYDKNDMGLDGHWDYEYFENILPLGIAGYLTSINDLIQKTNHQEFLLSLGDKESQTLFLKGLLNQLFFILNWFQKNIESYNKPEINNKRWANKDFKEYKCTVKDNKLGYIEFRSISNNSVLKLDDVHFSEYNYFKNLKCGSNYFLFTKNGMIKEIRFNIHKSMYMIN